MIQMARDMKDKRWSVKTSTTYPRPSLYGEFRMTSPSPETLSNFSTCTPLAMLSEANSGDTSRPFQLDHSASTRLDGCSSSGQPDGSKTNSQIAAYPPAVGVENQVMSPLRTENNDELTAWNSTAYNTCHRHACIQKFGLLRRFNGNASVGAHFSHFASDVL